MFDRLNHIISEHNSWRLDCINLVASENVMSPLARKAIQSDFGHRYFFQNIHKFMEGFSYSHRGVKFISEMVDIGIELAKELFGVDYASLYPLSGHQANLGVLFAFCKTGDSILCNSPANGGYPGLDKQKLPKYLGLNVEYLPWDVHNFDMIDIEKTISIIERIKPKILLLSSAHTLFPIKLNDITEVCRKHSCILVYDGSHPLGLIAGNKFQKPIEEGSDLLIGGTQKSFPGPQGGIILTNKHADKIKAVEHFVLVDNSHLHRIAALTITLLEMKYYGDDYADQIIRNSKHLAKHLSNLEVPVHYEEYGFTESHILKLKINKDYEKLTSDLERANIIVDNSGRIGCNEMTRFGMKESEMEKIAELIAHIFHGNNSLSLKNEVISLRKDFQDVNYCFQDDFLVNNKLY